MPFLKLLLLHLLFISPLLAETNDDFANPSHIGTVADGYVFEGSYFGAGVEQQERDFYRLNGVQDTEVKQTVWFTFTVPSDGIWKIDVGYPSDWAPTAPSYPLIFKDGALAQAVPAFPTDNRPTGGKALLRTGQLYRLGLRANSAERSYYKVTFKSVPAPSGDAIADASLAPGNSFTIQTMGATLEAGEAAGVAGEVLGSSWVKWKAPSSGKWLLKAPSVMIYDDLLGSSPSLFPAPDFSWEPGPWPPESRVVIGVNGAELGSRNFAIFDQPVASAPIASAERGVDWTVFEAEQGHDYWIAGYDRWNTTSSGINLELEPAAPTDFRENSQDLGSASAVRCVGHFLGASVSAGESVPAVFPVARTVWLKWTAGAAGPVILELDGRAATNPSPRVAVQVFHGETLAGSAEAGSYGREWRFDAVAGETYHFQVSVEAHPSPSFSLGLRSTEAADSFAQAIELTDSTRLSGVGSTLEPGEPLVDAGEGSVWLRWESPVRQVVSFHHQSTQAVGRDYGTRSRMEVFKGSVMGGLVPACTSGSPDSALFVAEAGGTYYVRILSKQDTHGEIHVQVASAVTGTTLQQLMMEAGATLSTPVADPYAAALVLVDSAHLIAPQDVRVLIASALLEIRAAAATPAGRILASRLRPEFGNLLPVRFIPSAEAGADGIIPAGLSMDEYWDEFDSVTWPHLSKALQRFLSIREPAASYHHWDLPMYPSGRADNNAYLIDAHDRRTMAAMISALRGGVDYLKSLDGSLPASEFFGWLCDGSPSLQMLLDDHPGFLAFGTADHRFSSWLWMAAAVEQEDIAEGLYKSPFFGADNSLYNSTLQSPLTRWFGWLRSSSGPVVVAWDQKVDLSKWLFGTVSPRDLLPEVKGNRLQPYSVADRSFGGLLPEITRSQLHDAWALRGWLADHETLAAWMKRHFGEESIVMSTGEDTDGDGIPLVQEFAFGQSPENGGEASYHPSFERQHLNDGTWATDVKFRRRIGRAGDGYDLYRSTDLQTWNVIPVPDDAEPSSLSGFEDIKVRVPDGANPAGRAFFKLRYYPPNPFGDGGIGVIINN